MKLSKTIKLAFNMLVHSKLRSWLTIVGIVIGVAAVVSIISIGQGLQSSVQNQLSGLGQDILSISSGSSRAQGPGPPRELGGESSSTNVKRLSVKDVQAIKLVPGVQYINSIVSGRANVKYNTETASMNVQGSDMGIIKEFLTVGIDSGRFVSKGELGAVTIGNKVAKGTFRNDLQVGYIIFINGKPFRIAGILSQSSGFGSSDNMILMNEKDARDVLSANINLTSNEFSSISVKVADVSVVNETGNKIENALLNSRHEVKNKADFSVVSPLALQQRVTQVLGGITIFLSVIAAVSLLVGGIGVANTMFTSVLEKTRDIGIMKAIGAKNSDILLLFLFNSGMLGLVGGIIGSTIGAIITYLVPYTGAKIGLSGIALQTSINFNLLFFALLFSIIIGMISGATPAYNASKLKPVEALRYE